MISGTQAVSESILRCYRGVCSGDDDRKVFQQANSDSIWVKARRGQTIRWSSFQCVSRGSPGSWNRAKAVSIKVLNTTG